MNSQSAAVPGSVRFRERNSLRTRSTWWLAITNSSRSSPSCRAGWAMAGTPAGTSWLAMLS